MMMVVRMATLIGCFSPCLGGVHLRLVAKTVARRGTNLRFPAKVVLRPRKRGSSLPLAMAGAAAARTYPCMVLTCG